jgi:hypothetical protein
MTLARTIAELEAQLGLVAKCYEPLRVADVVAGTRPENACLFIEGEIRSLAVEPT